MMISVDKTHDYARDTDSMSGTVTTDNFVVGIFPDTAKTVLGQTRQVWKIARVILAILNAPKIKSRHHKPYVCHPKDWMERLLRHSAVQGLDARNTYIHKGRKKNRPGYITDSVCMISIEWRHHWSEASRNTWPIGQLIAESLNRRHL